ncbi:MAG TPA: universal stress protein [Flavobacteriales bacterium]
MAHLLIPTDLSDLSLKAATFAVDLFGAQGNTFTLVHTSSDPGPALPLMRELPALRRREDEGLADLERRLRAERDMTGAHVRRLTASGPLPAVITEAAHRTDIDLVVMGTRGRNPHSYTGTHTTDVILEARVPVLEIPVELRNLTLQHILFGDDGAPIAPSMLHPLAAIARSAKARITIVHVDTGRTRKGRWDNTPAFKDAFKGIDHTDLRAESNDVEQALLGLAVREHTDLIAVLHRNRGLLSRLFTPSMSKAVALHSLLPVLILPS